MIRFGEREERLGGPGAIAVRDHSDGPTTLSPTRFAARKGSPSGGSTVNLRYPDGFFVQISSKDGR